jgi:hypothetical protein
VRGDEEIIIGSRARAGHAPILNDDSVIR